MSERSKRLRELFWKEIAEAIREVKDPGLSGFVTITDLELSADQKTADVYYSIIGNSQQKASSEKALNRASAYLRQILRKRLRLKIIPQFVFIYDETPTRAARVDRIFLRLENGEESQ